MDISDSPHFSDFYDAAYSSLDFLQEKLPFGLWMFTRANEETDEWAVIASADRKYGVQDGDVFKWSDSFCSRMVKGLGPCIAPCSDDIEAYRDAPIRQKLDIRSYIGIPLKKADGEFFGTLCAIDNEEKDNECSSAIST